MLTAEQQEMRRTGIGGSEIAAILGESAFATPFDVWLAKTHGWRQAETEDMRRGTFLEDGIARWYAQRFELSASMLDEHGTVRHATNPIALCTPDRIVGGLARRLVSIKAPRRKSSEWGEPGSGVVPAGYALQLQWEHLVCSSHGALSEEMHLAALLDGDLVVYILRADVELQGWLLQYATDWWERHVVRGEQPGLDGSSQAKDWLKSRFARDTRPLRQATPWEDLRMLELRHAEHEAGAWEREAETIRNELRLSIGDAAGIQSPAGVVTWKADKNGKRSFKTKWTTKEQS